MVKLRNTEYPNIRKTSGYKSLTDWPVFDKSGLRGTKKIRRKLILSNV